jgi:hypothetical protein
MAKVRLGVVQYTDGNGYAKLAFVTGTRKTVQKGTGVTRPEKGHANLLVVSPLKPGDPSKWYTRDNVPQGDGPRTWAPIAPATENTGNTESAESAEESSDTELISA